MKIFAVMILFFQIAHAKDLSVKSCLESLPEASIGKIRADLISSCLSDIEKKAKPSATGESLDGKFKFFGYKDILIFYKDDQFHYYFGPNTYLKDIKALTFDEIKKEIIVLDHDHLLTFPLKHSGNIGPSRILENKTLIEASDVEIDSHSGQIIVVNTKAKELQFFSREASIYALKEQRNFNPLRVVALKDFLVQELNTDSDKHLLHLKGKSDCMELDLKQVEKSLRQADCLRP
jgi:hypothetical protein